MKQSTVRNVITICVALVSLFATLLLPCFGRIGFCEVEVELHVLHATEIKDEGVDSGLISLSEVIEVRKMTSERIYGLAGMWFLILITVYLLRLQVVDDKELYFRGYYNSEL